MNILRGFWRKICEPLDGFLWQRDITHHLVRPALRNQILIGGASILAGAVCYAILPHIFWFGVGLMCITWIFWSWARFFLKVDLANYSAAFLRAILLRFALRLCLLALFVYFALAVCKAPAGALLTGMAAGSVIALCSYAINMKFSGRPR